jgi:lipid-A-disaccharide synthase
LIREIRRRRPEAQLVGYGGPRMAEAGCQLCEDLTQLAVMLLLRALANLHKFLSLLVRANREMRKNPPDAVVLIDYPGFNWWIARLAKARGIPVFYYGAPQMWAWAGWRIRKMRRLVDHVLCKLPFEAAWYRQRGCNAVHVGHPYFDETHGQRLDRRFLDEYGGRPGRLVTILPGSRTQEVAANLPWFLKAAAIIRRDVPDVRFAVAAFNERQAAMARRLAQGSDRPPDVLTGRTPELIHLAECCMACSGSVSLELLHHAKPAVILYWVSRLAYFVRGFLLNVKYITLVNLLAEDDLSPQDLTPYDPTQPGAENVPYPEYLTCEDKTPQIAAHITQWMTDEGARDARVARLRELKEKFGVRGASSRAAEHILRTLGARRGDTRRVQAA